MKRVWVCFFIGILSGECWADSKEQNKGDNEETTLIDPIAKIPVFPPPSKFHAESIMKVIRLGLLQKHESRCQTSNLPSPNQIKNKVIDFYQQRGMNTSDLLQNEPKCADEQEFYYKKIIEQLALAHPDTNSSSTVILEKKE